MIKKSVIGLLTILVLPIICSSQQLRNDLRSPGVPTSATIEIVLVDAPGINDDQSHWEAAYEVRIATDAAIWDAHKRKEEQVGEILKQGSFKGVLGLPAKRRIVLTVPFSSEIQSRLKNQPLPGESTKAKLTAEQSRELETRGQNLLVRSVVEIYDSKLRKTILVPIFTSRSLINSSESRIAITIKINAAGDYRWNASGSKSGTGKQIIRNP